MSFSSSDEVIVYSFSLYWVFVTRSCVFFLFDWKWHFCQCQNVVLFLQFFSFWKKSTEKSWLQILTKNHLVQLIQLSEKVVVMFEDYFQVWSIHIVYCKLSEKIIIHWFLSHLPLSNVNRGAVDLDGRIEPGDMLLQVCAAFPYLLYIHF